MSNTPTIKETATEKYFKRWRITGVSCDLKIARAVSAGKVPMPNKNIKRNPGKAPEVTEAAASAAYTNPQGKNPLKNPIPRK